jgi:hypothetical protein
MDRIEHKQAYNINIVNIGNNIIWKSGSSTFAFRFNDTIYITYLHNRKEKVSEYIYLIKQMKSKCVHLDEYSFVYKLKECFGNE